MSSEVVVPRIWNQLSRFRLFLCVHLFSARYWSLDLGPVQKPSAQVFTICQSRWSFPLRQIRRKVAIQLYRSVLGLMGSYDCVRRMIVSFFVSLSFTSLVLALAAQEVFA
jgi:hypothetical protein